MRSRASRSDVEERQRTLEATIAWSYDLLDAEEQRVLRALSVFAGGCTLEAAEAVAGADLDLLESLLDKSLLRHRIDEAGQDRYWMLETIREYATARLAEAAEAGELTDAYRAFFVSLAAELGPVPGRPRTTEEFDRFRADRANFREALLGSIEGGDARSALRLIRFLGSYWHRLRELADSYAVARRALALVGGSTDDRAHALGQASVFAAELGKVDVARAMLADSESVFATAGDLAGLAEVATLRGFLEASVGNSTEAIDQCERALDLARQAGDENLAATARAQLAFGLQIAALETDPPDAAKLERALATDAAQLEYLRRAGASPTQEADVLSNVAFSLTLLSRHAEALQHVQEALQTRLEVGVTDPQAVLNAGFVAGGLARHRQAAAIAARALQEFDNQGMMVQARDRRLLDRLESDVRAALGDEGHQEAIRTGQAMTLDQAVELALSLEAPETA